MNEKFLKFICDKCSYKFSRKEGSPVALRCPYCGANELSEDKFDVDQAIKEADF